EVDMAVLEKEILLELALFMDQLPSTPFRIAIVTNEVGCGIVPESALARAFRDLAGRANQMVAARADTVYLTVSGLPLKLKGGA
ncbi:MAG: bifunctional adenosylcobinamide kinase/adenosylcobinamide-phosphate guanylyltransferase, partial [Firmicutes bacterium]|nr:bifunctional adenosylcobinamide kinase/adenosylcobinamide-phosphate guanylyltransferase [Bacillota bacterium]